MFCRHVSCSLAAGAAMPIAAALPQHRAPAVAARTTAANGVYPCNKGPAGSTQHKHKENTSPNTSHPSDAEPYHPITAPLTHPHGGAQHGAARAEARGEGSYLISNTSWRLSSYFFFHAFASISLVII